MPRTRVPYSPPATGGSTSPFLCEGVDRERNLRWAFLRSYAFSVQESYGERLKRRLRELGERSRGLFREACGRLSDGRFGSRVIGALRSRLQVNHNPARCFGAPKEYCLKDYA